MADIIPLGKMKIRVLESTPQISKLLRIAIVNKLRTLFKNQNTIEKLRKLIGIAFRIAMQATPEYRSLTTRGILQAELGVLAPTERMEKLIDHWIKHMRITPKLVRLVGQNIVGGIKVEMVLANYSDVLALSASVQATNKKRKLQWLQWLLEEGDRRIVVDYDIEYNFDPDRYNSRTGLAIMKKSDNRSWGVPSQYAGYRNKNFVTR